MRPAQQNPRVTRRRFLGLGMAGLVSTLAADCLWFEPQALELTQLQLPSGFAGAPVRILQISDLHLSTFNGYLAKVAEQATGLRPDIIVLTGDYLEEQRNIRGVLDFFRQLKAQYGIYAVQGNWEYWSRLEGENLRRHFARAGVQLLINERVDVRIGAHHLSILGLDYPSGSDHLKTLMQLSVPDRFNLLLSHVPAFSHQYLEAHIGLVLCGHTHGGQVRLPWVPPFYLPRYAGRFVSGLYHVSAHHTPLYVNRGVGTSVLPIRFLCRPELTLFTLGEPAAQT
ncbi:MAG: metallophosphoesterase [Deltaproteobacteria bacterium]|nr:metallophosphoesterase [Deltaproteobacteria bacterium]MBW2518917.1 metallophosphoesterase [Deltaproteobacteria bacterium]